MGSRSPWDGAQVVTRPGESMAADGAWPRSPGADEPDAPRTRRAVEQLRAILTGLESRLADSRPEPLAGPAAAALTEALEALARRMAEQEGAAAARFQALGAALQVLAERLEHDAAHQEALAARAAEAEGRIAGQLDRMLSELAGVRGAQAAEPEPRLIRLILAAASAAAAFSVLGAASVILMRPETPRSSSPIMTSRLRGANPRPSLSSEPAGQAAVRRSLPTAPVMPAFGPGPETYEAVAAALERGEAASLPRLTGLAQAGEARAQSHLAGLYEVGAAGVPRDLIAARRWTRRAAEGGERVAMHNLALYLAAGDGGGRDDAEAATWFRRAADRGVVDSQYNLGLLYEAGRGVEKNLREAYRWFAVAANAGDVTAREKQVELEARLTPAERGGLDREVSEYRPGQAAPGDLALVIPPAQTLAETQALLARKGYYLGPVDGVASPALRSAAAAYSRAHPETAERP